MKELIVPIILIVGLAIALHLLRKNILKQQEKNRKDKNNQ